MAATEPLTPQDRVVLAIARSGLTQKKIAERSGLAQATITELKTGVQRLRFDQAVKLAEATEQIDLLLDWRDAARPPDPPDEDEHRSTCIPRGAGEKALSVAA